MCVKGLDVSSVLGADFVGPKSSQKEQIRTKIEVTCFDQIWPVLTKVTMLFCFTGE